MIPKLNNMINVERYLGKEKEKDMCDASNERPCDSKGISVGRTSSIMLLTLSLRSCEERGRVKHNNII